MTARSRAAAVLALVLAALAALLLLVHRPHSDVEARLAVVTHVTPPQAEVGRPLFNSREGRPVLDGTVMRPGETRSGTVTIRNDSKAPQDVVLHQQDLVPTGQVPNAPEPFDLSVTDSTTARTLYSGPLTALRTVRVCGRSSTPARACAPWAAGEEHRVEFVVRMADVGNEWAGVGWTASYVWVATTPKRGSA